jgi:hypothetical protein
LAAREVEPGVAFVPAPRLPAAGRVAAAAALCGAPAGAALRGRRPVASWGRVRGSLLMITSAPGRASGTSASGPGAFAGSSVAASRLASPVF